MAGVLADEPYHRHRSELSADRGPQDLLMPPTTTDDPASAPGVAGLTPTQWTKCQLTADGQGRILSPGYRRDAARVVPAMVRTRMHSSHHGPPMRTTANCTAW